MDIPFHLLDDPDELAKCGGWSKEVYADLLAIQQTRMDSEAFRRKYLIHRAIFILDMTSFTENTLAYGPVDSFLRILTVQQITVPIIRRHGAVRVRTFADDVTATFNSPQPAMDAALEVIQRVDEFNASGLAGPHPARACIGLGYGEVFCIGLDMAMGDEMNRASKLGEDTAKGGEILVTENVYREVNHRRGLAFEPRNNPEIPFPYYSVRAKQKQSAQG